MIEAKFTQRFDYAERGMAHTLDPSDLGSHASGWTVEGRVHEDYYEWVNNFQAVHPELGIVCGDFESEVLATSQEAYDHFVAHHGPHEWDYADI